MTLEGGLERCKIVPARDHHVLQHAGRDAGRAGDRHRLVGRPGLVQRRPRADVGLVAPAVIVALELQDLVAAGEGTGQPHCHQHGLGAGRGEAHNFGAGQQPAEPFGELGLARMLGGIDLAVGQGAGHRLDDRLGRMAQDRGAIAQDIVDMDVAIDVVEPCPLAAGEEQRNGRAGIAHVAADAAGQVPFRPFVERDRLVVSAHGPLLAKSVITNNFSSRNCGQQRIL